MDIKYVLTALSYAILGLSLGIYMAASGDHGHLVTHAHIMLAGFVVSFIYALCHKLWLHNTTTPLAKWQFYLHQTGLLLLVLGLFLLYGDHIKEETIEPVLSVGSLAVFTGMILMMLLFIKATKKN